MVREWSSLLTFPKFKKAEDALVDFNDKNFFFFFWMLYVRKQFGEFAKGLENKRHDHNCSATIM